MLRSHPPAFFREHVRHLSFTWSDDIEEVRQILDMCSDLVAVNVYFGNPSNALLPALAAMPLQRLGVSLRKLFGPPSRSASIGVVDFSHPLFSHITHLALFDYVALHDWLEWSGLSQIPHLSHLSFNQNYSARIFDGVLESCRALKVLAVIDRNATKLPGYLVAENFVRDPRFVLLAPSPSRDDWAEGVLGGEDCWVIAEEFIKKRHSGEVPGGVDDSLKKCVRSYAPSSV